MLNSFSETVLSQCWDLSMSKRAELGGLQERCNVLKARMMAQQEKAMKEVVELRRKVRLNFFVVINVLKKALRGDGLPLR